MVYDALLDALLQGVDDPTWMAYSQQLKAAGAHVIPYDLDEHGSEKFEVYIDLHGGYRVQRGADRLWYLT